MVPKALVAVSAGPTSRAQASLFLSEAGYGDYCGTRDVAVWPGAGRLVRVFGLLAGVLDGEEEGAAVRGEEGAGELALDGAARELVDVSAAARGHHEGAVVLEGFIDAFVEPARGDVGDDPEVPARVEGEVVGASETGLRAAGGEDLEGELLCFCVASVFADPEYLPVEVAVLGVI